MKTKTHKRGPVYAEYDSGHNKVVTMCLESYPETMTIVEFNNCVDQIVFESKRRTSKHF